MGPFGFPNKKTTISVGIGEMKFAVQPQDVLVTYALGSCVSLTLYDPVLGIGGLIHCKLPKEERGEKAILSPFTYVDPGVLLMVNKMLELRGQKSRLVAKIFGGANVIDDNGVFRIGEQNIAVMKTLLQRQGIPIQLDRTGGNMPRTVFLHIDTGKTILKTGVHVEVV